MKGRERSRWSPTGLQKPSREEMGNGVKENKDRKRGTWSLKPKTRFCCSVTAEDRLCGLNAFFS